MNIKGIQSNKKVITILLQFPVMDRVCKPSDSETKLLFAASASLLPEFLYLFPFQSPMTAACGHLLTCAFKVSCSGLITYVKTNSQQNYNRW
jgi:hypothetical protein